jgi:hypothetical protein
MAEQRGHRYQDGSLDQNSVWNLKLGDQSESVRLGVNPADRTTAHPNATDWHEFGLFGSPNQTVIP